MRFNSLEISVKSITQITYNTISYYSIISRKYLNIKLLNIYYFLMNIDICQVYQDLLSLLPIFNINL